MLFQRPEAPHQRAGVATSANHRASVIEISLNNALYRHTILRWAKKDVAALHLAGRRCKSVCKLGSVLWRRCKSVHETIAIRHISCIQFSDISAAQVHAERGRGRRSGALLRIHTIERYCKSCSIAMCHFNAYQQRR